MFANNELASPFRFVKPRSGKTSGDLPDACRRTLGAIAAFAAAAARS